MIPLTWGNLSDQIHLKKRKKKSGEWWLPGLEEAEFLFIGCRVSVWEMKTLWKWMVATCGCNYGSWVVHWIMVNFMWCTFCHNKKRKKNDRIHIMNSLLTATVSFSPLRGNHYSFIADNLIYWLPPGTPTCMCTCSNIQHQVRANFPLTWRPLELWEESLPS